MKKTFFSVISFFTLMVVANQSCARPGNDSTKNSSAKQLVPDADNAGLKLPDGFGAIQVATGLGQPRHIAVTSKGDIYIKLAELKGGKGIYYLHDANGDGKPEVKTGFGNYGGTGMAVKNGYLYASSNTDGNRYVNIGAYSNACQEKDRTKGSPGIKRCPILDSAGGIWQFKADKLNQTYGDGVRYATGLRNVVGLDWNTDVNALFVTQHGRDQLHDLFPDLYDTKLSAELPAECMYQLKKGDNAGWPYIYYDQIQHKKILAPEFGGDGKKTAGEDAIDPIVAFPGHMAPNGLLFYEGNMFPEKYKHGAFVAFHGSCNRAPEPQKGFFVAFVPFKDGKPSGDWEVFADNFAGGNEFMQPGTAKHRPCGLAQGPDGSLYVSDDQGGTIYRIIYTRK